MLGLAVEGIGVKPLLGAGKELHRAAGALDVHAQFHKAAALPGAVRHRPVDVGKVTGAVRKQTNSVRQRHARQDVHIGQPGVVHVRVFDRPPALGGDCLLYTSPSPRDS